MAKGEAPQIVIREMVRADALHVARLSKASTPRLTEEECFQLFRNGRGVDGCIVEVQGAVVAYAILQPYPTHVKLLAFDIDPSFRARYDNVYDQWNRSAYRQLPGEKTLTQHMMDVLAQHHKVPVSYPVSEHDDAKLILLREAGLRAPKQHSYARDHFGRDKHAVLMEYDPHDELLPGEHDPQQFRRMALMRKLAQALTEQTLMEWQVVRDPANASRILCLSTRGDVEKQHEAYKALHEQLGIVFPDMPPMGPAPVMIPERFLKDEHLDKIKVAALQPAFTPADADAHYRGFHR